MLRDLSGVDTDQLERAKGFEPSTPTLARSCSTPELHPHPLRGPARVAPRDPPYGASGGLLQEALHTASKHRYATVWSPAFRGCSLECFAEKREPVFR